MTKNKLIVGTLLLIATALFTTSSFGQACSSGINPHYVGIGSSAEFETLGFGANRAIQNIPAYNAVTNPSGYLGPVNIWSNAAAQVIDTRPGTVTGLTNTIDAGLKVWVIYDSNPTCNLFIGYQADSVQGTKDFYCYKKVPTGYVGTMAGCYGYSLGTPASWEQQNGGGNVLFGLPDNVAGQLPVSIQSFIAYTSTEDGPAPVSKTCGSKGTTQCLPAAYCGQLGNTAGTPEAATAYCYFNVAHTDIRPEDGLYATTRALSSYNTTNSVTGLGYNQAACGAVVVTAAHTTGCPVYDSFGKKAVFYPLNFALKTADPYTAAVLPGSTTLSIGATPVVVFVNNTDTSNLGFGVTATDQNGHTRYLHKDINHKVLAHIFDGTDSCTGDLLATTPTPSLYGGTIAGAGQPIQAIVREPLSGTYNTFEFTAVRTLSGSAATAVGQSKITTVTWLSDDASSQELDPYLHLGTVAGSDGPAFDFGVGGCPGSAAATGTAPSATCGDPLDNPGGTCTGSTSGHASRRLRAIGTGEEVAATLSQDNVSGTDAVVEDGIGYSFWGYSNFKPGASGCSGSATSGDVTCGTYNGHYLTVDGIDPLYYTEGGEFDPTTTTTPSYGVNPNGAFNFPQCGLIQKVSGYSFPCTQIPFYHIYDGKYPLWSLLRLVTFNNINATATVNGQHTPEGVINLLAYAQLEAAPGSAEQLSDFVPFLNSINIPGGYYSYGAAVTGNLNLGVFRSHYTQSLILPYNGHSACLDSFTGVNLTGGSSSGQTCLVDAGGDVGGSVLTVQSDVDFNLDFGGQEFANIHTPAEIYGLHQ